MSHMPELIRLISSIYTALHVEHLLFNNTKLAVYKKYYKLTLFTQSSKNN